MQRKKVAYTVITTSLIMLLFGCSSSEEPKKEEAKQVGLQTEDTKATHTSAKHEVHWSYEGETGPEHWGDLDPANSACTNGTEQSPIDIELAKVKIDKTLANIEINYEPTSLTVMNNGHTIQANDASGNNSIIIEGKTYKLLQVHFHKPSENQINGKSFDMEGHLVHKNDEGELAVLGFLISKGKENKALAEMFSKLPTEKTEKDITLHAPVDLMSLLPENKKVFRYKGSLTTPPCSENVNWNVFEAPIEMSEEQIKAFGSIFPHNSRPIQPLNDREIVTN